MIKEQMSRDKIISIYRDTKLKLKPVWKKRKQEIEQVTLFTIKNIYRAIIILTIYNIWPQ